MIESMMDKKYICQIGEKMCNLEKKMIFSKISFSKHKQKPGGFELMTYGSQA